MGSFHKLLAAIHRDEQGALSLEAVLIIAVIALSDVCRANNLTLKLLAGSIRSTSSRLVPKRS